MGEYSGEEYCGEKGQYDSEESVYVGEEGESMNVGDCDLLSFKDMDET